MTPDVNVLVAAFRDDHVHHRTARAWLSGALESCSQGGTVEILPMVAAGFLRVVTNRRVFPRGPASPAEAVSFLRRIFAIPGVVMPSLGSEWGMFERLCVDLEVTGTAVSDAWIAAAVIAGGLHLVTFDTDFTRLLRPTQYTLLSRSVGIAESRPRDGVRKVRGKRRARRAA